MASYDWIGNDGRSRDYFVALYGNKPFNVERDSDAYSFGQCHGMIIVALTMVGYLAAVTQSPIIAFVIVIEMINGHALVISLMATALIAARVSRFFAPPLYDALSTRFGHATPPHTAR